MIDIKPNNPVATVHLSSSSQWKESISSHKKEISSLMREMGKLKVNVLDFNTKLQLHRFGDLLQTYDEQLQHLMIDLFLTEQDVEREKNNKEVHKQLMVQNAFKTLLDRLKAFESSFATLKKEFKIFWDLSVSPAVRVN